MDNTDLQMAASAIEQSDTSEMDGKYLTFWTDGQLFGVPIADVVQIVGMQNITNIPEFPHYAKGVINLRGSIIPLIDMRLRLAKQEAPYDERTCIIVTNIEQRDVGFIVDEVDEVLSVSGERIVPPPQIAGNNAAYITGIGKLDSRVVLLMDTRKIVGEDELASLSDITGTEN